MEHTRVDGYAPIASYGVIGDGRSVALVSKGGAIDWWCAPSLDASPIFSALLNADAKTHYNVRPTGKYSVTHNYSENSNVLCTLFETESGKLEIKHSLNSGTAGRLPWSELAQTYRVTEGTVELECDITFDSHAWHDSKHLDQAIVYSGANKIVSIVTDNKAILTANSSITLHANESLTIGLIVTEGEPQLVPSVNDVATRLDESDQAWKAWANLVNYKGEYRDQVVRSSLALKLLLYSPSGAIAAAGTMGLPEKIGGEKNYDYRFAWIRDVCYTIKAFMRAGLHEEVQAALSWLLKTLDRHKDTDLMAFYTLMGEVDGDMQQLDIPGYRDTEPVYVGNQAADQLQLSVFGDILETIHLFVSMGNQLDQKTIATIERLLEACQKLWQKEDSGIWELPDKQHYTMSKIGCWLAFDRAVKLCELRALPNARKNNWQQTRDDIKNYIETNCWNQDKQAYVQYAGTDKLDASLMLATRFGYPNNERLKATLRAIRRELQVGPLVYRYTGADKEEGAFVACSYWLVEGYAFLGECDKAHELMQQVLGATTNELGLMSEMVDPKSGEFLGNVPQGLSHLAMIHAADALSQT